MLLDSITVKIAAGACTAVVGPSGAGKSTLLRVLNQLEEPDTGRVCWQGTPLPDMDAPALRRRIGLVAQQPVLLAERVLDELWVGQPRLTGQTAKQLLNRVGLAETFAKRRSAELPVAKPSGCAWHERWPWSLKYCCWTNRLQA